jgi:hypothetical protein
MSMPRSGTEEWLMACKSADAAWTIDCASLTISAAVLAGVQMGVGAASVVEVDAEVRPWWETRLCLTLVVLATMLPLVYPPVPPLVDLLGHMGRYRVELDLHHSPWLQQYYDYHWAAIGNLGVDLLIIPLGKLFGLELVVKLIVLTIPPLTAIGMLWVSREVHGRISPTAFFALPFIYGFPFMLGFVNFTLSVALAFIACGLWLRLSRLERQALRAWLFVPISLIVFFCHVYGWGLLGLMCFSAEAVSLHDRGRSWWRAGIDAALHTSVMALPLLVMLVWRSETHGGETSGWFDWNLKWRWIYAALRDRWGFFDMASLAFVGLIFIYGMASPKMTLSRKLAFVAIVLAASFVTLPRIISGSAYADMRFVPFVFAVALLAVRPCGPTDARTGQFLAILGLLFFVGRIAANTASLASAARDQSAKLQAIDFMPRGARVASFYELPESEPWSLPRDSHLGAFVIVRREGFSNEQWVMEGVNLLDLKYRTPGGFDTEPSEIVRPAKADDRLYRTIEEALAQVPRDRFDYIWLINSQNFDPALVRGMTPVWRGPGTVLYRIRPQTPSIKSL